jgi:serine phosphatase RsbU (regulator of sigma subunit)
VERTSKGDKPPKKKWQMPIPRSLRNQLIGSVWLGVAAVFIPFNIYTINRDTRDTLKKEILQLEDRGQIISHLFYRWKTNVTKLIDIVAQSQEVRSGDAETIKDYFLRIQKLYPKRNWTLLDRSGKVIADTNRLSAGLREEIREKRFVEKAVSGRIGIDISPECISREACVLVSSPVYASEDTDKTSATPTVSMILVMSIDLSNSAKDSGIEGEFNRLSIGDGKRQQNGPWETISLQNNQFKGTEALMMDNQGDILFPLTNVNDQISLLESRKVQESVWAPILNRALEADGQKSVREVIAAGERFFVYTERIDPEWRVVVVSDKKSSLVKVNQTAKDLILRQLALLGVVSIVIAAVCQQAAKPVRRAGKTLKEFGRGNFEERIESTRSDEMGMLFNDINETGSKLLAMLNERLARAVTDKQIETATEIQKEFIVRKGLSNQHVEIAADFDPAYEIGADWYDVIHKGDVTYIVIADVCDKGIPSALFMSVFRSLMRYDIEKREAENENRDVNSVLASTIRSVNDYMAEHHGAAAMFATVFMAAYSKDKGCIRYVNAGHECPLVYRQGIWDSSERLETTGPAIGIFEGADYTVKSTGFAPGDVIFCFTDGLVDARSTKGESFGIDRVKEALNTMNDHDQSVKEILERVNAASRSHSEGAEQFDDKTLLVMKAVNSQPQ